MKKTVAFMVLSMTAIGLQATTVERILVRQQWPWHEGVKVEYALSGMTGAVDLEIKVYRDGTLVEVPEKAFSGDVYNVKSAVGSFTMDPVIAFGAASAKISQLRFELTAKDSSASMDEVLYRVFDLESATPAYVDITRADLLNGKYGAYETDYSKIGEGFTTPLSDVLIWTGVTNGITYKTTKLVMRKIPAGGKVWQCGTDDTSIRQRETKRYIKLTQDFFISVFEITQKQWELLAAGSNSAYIKPSYFKDLDDSDIRPVEYVYYYYRGNPVPGDTDRGVVTNEKINWPTNSYIHDVGKNYPMAKVWAKTGCEFDFPTEAQWEFACRAGTDASVYSGKTETQANVEELAWVLSNATETRPVGLKPANAYGLYDMLGNVMEMTLNYYSLHDGGTTSGDGLSAESPIVDPAGSDNVAKYDDSIRAKRGGSIGYDYPNTDKNVLQWYNAAIFAAYRGYKWSFRRSDMGFRLVCPATANGQWGDHPTK